MKRLDFLFTAYCALFTAYFFAFFAAAFFFGAAGAADFFFFRGRVFP